MPVLCPDSQVLVKITSAQPYLPVKSAAEHDGITPLDQRSRIDDLKAYSINIGIFCNNPAFDKIMLNNVLHGAPGRIKGTVIFHAASCRINIEGFALLIGPGRGFFRASDLPRSFTAADPVGIFSVFGKTDIGILIAFGNSDLHIAAIHGK